MCPVVDQDLDGEVDLTLFPRREATHPNYFSGELGARRIADHDDDVVFPWTRCRSAREFARHLEYDLARLLGLLAAPSLEAQVMPAGRADRSAFEDRRPAVRAGPRLADGRAPFYYSNHGLAVSAALAAAFLPAELRTSAHARTVRYCQRSRADVAVDDPALVQLDALRAFDVALDFAGNDHGARADGTGEVGAGFDRQRAVDVDVALETAGDPDMAGALDLSLEVSPVAMTDSLRSFRAATATVGGVGALGTDSGRGRLTGGGAPAAVSGWVESLATMSFQIAMGILRWGRQD